MDKIMFMAIVGTLLGIGCAISLHNIGFIFIGLGLGALSGGMLGYLDGDFQKNTFQDIDRQAQERRYQR